jgi:PAS domain-containing protein
MNKLPFSLSETSIKVKFYAAFSGLLILILMLIALSIHSVRQQSAYHEQLDVSSQAANNVERVNGLIFAVVMESRGIYMSNDTATVKRYGEALLRRNRELAEVMDQWQRIVRDDDMELFAAFKARVSEFIRFRVELVRRANVISQAAGREWGDNDANRKVRTELNEDLSALATVYFKRAYAIAQMGKQVEFTTVLLMILGIGAIALTWLAASLFKASVIEPLLAITSATDSIASGKILITIPHTTRKDEIGKLAEAVQQLQSTTERNRELQKSELATSRERDHLEENKVHLIAAINNMAQGLIMLDVHANVILMNESYRKMYNLPKETVASSCNLRDILRYRAESGLFSGDTNTYVRTILTRIALGQPSVSHVDLKDGRRIRVFEQPTPDGGWVATHEDFTKQQQLQQTLERMERLFGTIVENVHEAILAKDALTHRYLFVNRAAETLFGVPRAAMVGRTARDVFGDATAEKIESPEKVGSSGKVGSPGKAGSPGKVVPPAPAKTAAVTIQTITTPGNGERVAAIRHLPASGGEGGGQYVISLIDDQTDHVAPMQRLRTG